MSQSEYMHRARIAAMIEDYVEKQQTWFGEKYTVNSSSLSEWLVERGVGIIDAS